MRCLQCLLLACVLGLVVVACSSKPISDTCGDVSSTGAAPNCVLTANCVGAHTGVVLDCSGNNGQCVCSENGVTGATVSYQSSFCSGGTAGDAASFESALDAANGACGWQL